MTVTKNLARPEPPVKDPYYWAPLRRAVARVFAKFSTFSERASRSEYWWWVMMTSCIYVPIRFLISVFSRRNPRGELVTGPAGIFFQCLLVTIALIWFLPTLSLTVRRLHDANITGSVALVGLMPAISVTPFGGWVALASPAGVALVGLVAIICAIALLIIVLLPPNPRGHRFDAPKTQGGLPATLRA